jgi:hypothetical protein
MGAPRGAKHLIVQRIFLRLIQIKATPVASNVTIRGDKNKPKEGRHDGDMCQMW